MKRTIQMVKQGSTWVSVSAKKKSTAIAVAATGMMASAGSAFAATIDTAAVKTGIDAAEQSALTTGEYVIGTVVSLVVITLVVAMVKKI